MNFSARIALLLALVLVALDQSLILVPVFSTAALIYPHPSLALLFALFRTSLPLEALVPLLYLNLGFLIWRIAPRFPQLTNVFSLSLFIAAFSISLLASAWLPLQNMISFWAALAILLHFSKTQSIILKFAYAFAATALFSLLLQNRRALPELYRIFDRNNPTLQSVYDVRRELRSPIDFPASGTEVEIRRLDGTHLRISGDNWITDGGRNLIHPLVFVHRYLRLLSGNDDSILLAGQLSKEFCDLIPPHSKTLIWDQHRDPIPCSLDEVPPNGGARHQVLYESARFDSLAHEAISTWTCDLSTAQEISVQTPELRFDRANDDAFRMGRAWFPIGQRFLCRVESGNAEWLAKRKKIARAAQARFLQWVYPW